jgi:mono/diheme cytochrome c family protein
VKHINRRRLGMLLVVGIAFTTVVAFASTAYSQEARPAGQQLYERDCGFCHGLYGEGKVGVPILAGAAGHLERFGVPLDAAVGGLVDLVREGIPGRMPAYPPEILTDADIINIGNHIISLPPATGTSLYVAGCGFCHGPGGEGVLAPPLDDAAEFIAAQGWDLQQTTQVLTELVREGIPGLMPGFPHWTDVEIERLAVFLMSFDEHNAWEAEFEAAQGRPPALRDYHDRMWSLEFTARTGRGPTAADWDNYWEWFISRGR